MSYFKVLGFDREPFSTSPDPEFFFLSKEHETALTNILIELRLKRGLSVILGDVGTGKTTLSRKLIQELKSREDFIFHIILNPSFESEEIFLKSLVRNFEIPDFSGTPNPSVLDLRETLERFLYQKGVTEGKTVVILVDEAQKLNEVTLENLRILLNYETNEFKLLQLILLGQLEFYSRIVTMQNFFDRISFKYTLNPLDFEETRDMIEFRVRHAGFKPDSGIFLADAVQIIHSYTRGYPRQVNMLCHKALKLLVLRNKLVVDEDIIKELIDEEVQSGWQRKHHVLQNAAITVN
ncbi:MAG TPA: AAA family ATPase [Candidatus Omnitrophota bacterium]|mgnify:CR=1 FL=1|nr:AAA family ATPase [Candidatus Omnitrophota bacterium]HPT07806.1 AAA family ATPase [Candidatus Omnitrophota bacterium]